MEIVVHVDEQFNLSLNSVKDILKIKPNDTFVIQRENSHTIILKKTAGDDPFIEAINSPAHIHNKAHGDLDQLEDELWSS